MLRWVRTIGLTATALAAYGAGRMDESGNSALFEAIRRGDTPQIRTLLRGGASPNARDAGGTTALMHAALEADAAAMKILLDKGADPNAANEAGATALMWGVQDAAKVKLLLS